MTVVLLVLCAAVQTAGLLHCPEVGCSTGLHSASSHHRLADPSLGLALPSQVLVGPKPGRAGRCPNQRPRWRVAAGGLQQAGVLTVARDRKSTRLNSSHVSISYAVFCLKKKKKNMYSRIARTVKMWSE